MCSPFSTAFLARMPAASITEGLLVFVHEVMAAMSTSPCPTSTGIFISCTSCVGTRSGVGRLVIISASVSGRSEEHTSELQSQSNLVCRLLLEKKKKQQIHDCKSRVTSTRFAAH